MWAQGRDFQALVIANSAYKGLTELLPAKVDGQRVADLLDKSGYAFPAGSRKAQVTSDIESKSEFLNQWADFLKRLRVSPAKETVAVFYFSGHGAEVNNDSFLLPTGLKQDPLEAHILNEGVRHRLLFDEFRKQQQALAEKDKWVSGIFIIDACRSAPADNNSLKKSGVIDKSGTRPIAPPPGIFVLYAASAGQVAHARLQDDPEPTASVYTRHLVPLLEQPYSLQTIARLVRWQVHVAVAAKKPSNPQTPQYFDDASQLDRVLTLKGMEPENPRERAKLQESKSPLTPGQRPEPGEAIWECEDCPHLVVVPSHTFWMGSPRDESGNNASEEVADNSSDSDRRLEVKIGQTFAMGITEVTVAQYRAYLTDDGKKGCPAGQIACGKQNVENPVHSVSWKEAQDYIAWLNRKLGLSESKPELGYYRLPTEAEWEYAARGGAGGRFVAESERTLCEYGNGADQELHALTLANTSCSDRKGRGVMPVKSYKPNGFGLFDVHGNVWEWVADCWTDTLTKAKANGGMNPDDMKNTTCRRVARGGSWLSAPEALRLAKRISFAPEHTRPTLGFRVARVLPVKQ